MPDTLLDAAVKELAADATVAALCTATPKITQDNPYNTIEGTGKLQLVVSNGPPWTSPTPRTTKHYPAVRVEAYSDPTRDSDGNVIANDANAKARAVLAAVTDVLNLVVGGVTWGDDFFVVSSHTRAEPMQVPRPVNDDSMRVWRVEFCVIHP